MSEETKLKPCPFCGGTNLYYAAGRFYAVECADCGGKVVGTFKTTEEAADAWNTRSQADAPDHAPKPTLKQAVCSIVEILERMKKQISYEGEDYLSLKITCFPSGHIGFNLFSVKAQAEWTLPEIADNFEKLKSFEFSENEIAEYLKSKIKTPAQKIQEEIEYKEKEIEELKSELARLEEKERK